ncbi:MAG: YdcF family protein [Planctomycetes bacterium]|nr:YdcF family protein [Planctomycetota bacterium]
MPVFALAGLCVAVLGASTWVWARGSALEFESVAELAPAPVAIVLGAGVHRDGTPSDALADRLEQAVELYHAGKVKKLLLTGDHRTRDYDETNCMRRWALEHGVAEEDVFCDHAGFSTHDSLARARQIFGVERAIVVTQAFHLPRALYTAAAMGIEAHGVACDRRSYRASAWFALRETGSRVKAFVQSGVLHCAPSVGGEPISIEGDGRATWDVR